MSKNDDHYSIILENEEQRYIVGTMIIKSNKGEIFYKPSDSTYLNEDESFGRRIEHISWHKSGNVHIKFKDKAPNKYKIIQENRTPISEIARQKLFSEVIKDITFLPKLYKDISEGDIAKKCEKKPIAVVCNLFDGKHYVKSMKNQDGYFDLSPINDVLIHHEMRSVSDGEINRSKCIEFIVYYLNKDLNKVKYNSGLYISYDEKIII